jgi:FkbM family methyltransferase
MDIHKLVYWFYSLARSVARAFGISRILRRTVGPFAARFVFNSTASTGHPLVIQGHKMYLSPKGRYPSPDMVVDRYEQATTEIFRQIVKPDMVVVDVGANVGYFSLLSAELVGQGGTVYAFEPEPKNHELLKKNIELNSYSNIQSIEMAVSDQCGSTQLFLSALDSGSHSIYDAGARAVRGNHLVTTTTLDAFLAGEAWPNVDLVKIDVEGAELKVLAGMERLTERSHAFNLIIEFCPILIHASGEKPSNLLDKLASMNFHIKFVDEKKGVLAPETANPQEITAKLFKQESYMNLLCSRK